MTDLSEHVILVTGATDGLGRGLAEHFAARGATVLVHGRSEDRVAATIESLGPAGEAKARGYLADFSALSQVRALAEALRAGEPRIDVIVNNAGIGSDVPGGPRRQTSADGFELRFAVNYLAPFLLTRLLLPVIRRSVPARIVNVSSAGQMAIDVDDPMITRNYTGTRAYCQSKLAQIMFTRALNERLDNEDITVNALHPATYMPTKIVSNPISTLAEGVDATARLAVDPALAQTTGAYFNGTRVARPDPQANDTDMCTWLWNYSSDLVGLPSAL
jgi:NAD(P)-dependent dehydrogenase (short-subunit alcohol dehydrogenase family)